VATRTIKAAPPKAERPRCRNCGKRLKPRYDTRAVTIEYDLDEETAAKAEARIELLAGRERRYTPGAQFPDPIEIAHQWNVGKKTIERTIQVASHNFRRRDDGSAYVVIDTGDSERRFAGKYGGYGDNTFCGLNCGYRWAVLVDAKLSKRKRGSFICYDEEAVDV
jgi:hypothetical protein